MPKDSTLVLLLLVSIIPAYLYVKYMKIWVRPFESPQRLFLFFLSVFVFLFMYIALVAYFILRAMPVASQ